MVKAVILLKLNHNQLKFVVAIRKTQCLDAAGGEFDTPRGKSLTEFSRMEIQKTVTSEK